VVVILQDTEHEDFYVCKWTVEAATGHPLLLLAGKLALIRVVNCHKKKAVKVAAAQQQHQASSTRPAAPAAAAYSQSWERHKPQQQGSVATKALLDCWSSSIGLLELSCSI
jgi:hypothetical protein